MQCYEVSQSVVCVLQDRSVICRATGGRHERDGHGEEARCGRKEHPASNRLNDQDPRPVLKTVTNLL